VQDLVPPLAEWHKVPASPFLQLAEVPLNGSTTLPVLCQQQLAEGTLCPVMQIIKEDVKWDQTQY